MIRTKNFNPISDPRLLCCCGHSDCDKRSVSQSELNKVQKVRDDTDRPLKINSGGRCPNHENEIHRKRPADHQKGQGLDVACRNGLERGELVNLAIKHGFNAIGVAKRFVHMGYREELGDKIVMWTY